MRWWFYGHVRERDGKVHTRSEQVRGLKTSRRRSAVPLHHQLSHVEGPAGKCGKRNEFQVGKTRLCEVVKLFRLDVSLQLGGSTGAGNNTAGNPQLCIRGSVYFAFRLD